MPSYPGRPPVNNWGNWLACRERSKIDARKPMGRTGVELHGRFRPLTEVDLPLIVIARNERRLIDPFLEHYRRLGVTRFLWLDDRSVDGSREILIDQADIDLLASNVSYREAHRGRLWREMIINRYGRNRWYVMVDTDEFLVFADCENFKLTELTKRLQHEGVKHLFAPMIDMYPGGTVEMALYDGQRMPWEVANKFDLTGYRIAPVSRGWHVEGGVRARLSGSAPLLTKYPLVFWDQKTNLNSSIHFPAPYERNFSPPKGVLLHFKFFSDFRNSFERIIAEGQHFDQGAYYESLLKHLEGAVTVLEEKSSVGYAGSAQLNQLRFFE